MLGLILAPVGLFIAFWMLLAAFNGILADIGVHNPTPASLALIALTFCMLARWAWRRKKRADAAKLVVLRERERMAAEWRQRLEELAKQQDTPKVFPDQEASLN